ncbi:hypothetical protein PQX77_003306 [Marasmius sp. AFHP31]|nr:hypothetical protein PQX77_003306 [Marasmius sp. AFHP31]
MSVSSNSTLLESQGFYIMHFNPSYPYATRSQSVSVKKSSDDPSQGGSQSISGSLMPMMSEALASAPEDVEDIRSSVAPSDNLPDYESELTDFSDDDDAGPDLQYPGEPTAVNPPSSSNANMVGSPPGRGN